MDKKYHRGNGEVVVPEMISPNKNWNDLPHNVQCNKIEEFDEHIASLPIYAYCDPSHPVGWIEGEEVYQVRGQILREWETVGKHLFSTHPEYLKRIWIEPKPKLKTMSETQNKLNKVENIEIAMSEPLLHLKRIIPLLEYRHRVAKNYITTMSYYDKENYEQLIERINEDIVKVLGL